MQLPMVIVVKNQVVDSARICNNRKHAEETFLTECESRLSNWDSYTPEDKEIILDQGYETFGNGSICLVWTSDEGE